MAYREPLPFRLFTSLCFRIARLHPPRKGVVLGYHSIDEDDTIISFPPGEFRRQMAFLKEEGYRSLYLDEYLDSLRGDAFEDGRSVVITFDDGFRSNYEQAFPILQEHGLKATVFLATDYVGRRSTWYEETADARAFPMLSWAEIREMARGGVRFEAHTCSHPHLPAIPRETAREEIDRNRRIIEEKLGRPCRFFCYPYGEYNTDVVAILKDLGFAGACTTDGGTCAYGHDPFLLKRGMVDMSCTAPFAHFPVYVSRLYDMHMAAGRVVNPILIDLEPWRLPLPERVREFLRIDEPV